MSLRKKKGVVATEAVLAFGVLLGLILLLWSTARIVYDQTNLETATRFAAQGALASYIQNSPIRCTNEDVVLADAGIFDDTPEGRRVEKCYEARWTAGTIAEGIFVANMEENRTRSLPAEDDFEDPYGSMISAYFDRDPIQNGPERLDVDCALLREDEDLQFSPESCEISLEDIEIARALVIRVRLRADAFGNSGFLGGLFEFLGEDFTAEASAYGWRRLNE